MTQTAIKLRFCPSPTGFIHLGNARTALFNELYSRHCGGVFLLRIEDTDKTRSKEEYTTQLMNDLRWLSLDWQEGADAGGENGPYWQSQRQSIYESFYEKLNTQGNTYPCFCSEEQLAITRKLQRASGKPPRYPGTCRNLSPQEIQQKLLDGLKPTYRFKVPKENIIEFTDAVKGLQRFLGDDIGDFIIRRTDGTAPFMYCNAIDDSMMGVTHVVRGEDHLTNTPRQILILQALGLSIPHYCHISLILGPDNAPLSKRNGSRNIAELRSIGYLSAAVINYLARLGHYYEDNSFMTPDQLAQQFDLAKLSSSPARFDLQQLDYWQKEAVSQLEQIEFYTWLGEETSSLIPSNDREYFYHAIKPNVVFPCDALLWANIIYCEKVDYDADSQVILKEAGPEFFEAAIQACDCFQDDFKQISQYVKDECQVKGKSLFQPLRLALTGQTHGPEMAALVKLIGKERLKSRFQAVLRGIV